MIEKFKNINLKRLWNKLPLNARILFSATYILGALCFIFSVIQLLFPNIQLVDNKTFIIPILAAFVTLIVMIYFLIKGNKKLVDRNLIYDDITSDDTEIHKINDNNEIESCKKADFKLIERKFFNGKKCIFIAITLTTDYLNIIHFAILGKLKQFEKQNITPIIYLTVINEEEKRKKIIQLFKRILYFYLKKPEIIMDHTLHNDTMNKLDETTINEVLDLFPDRKKDIGTNNYLISIMMPFIENDIQQKKETLVICGNDMKQFWNWNKIIRKKPPLLFILPTLKGLNGTDISPKSTDRDNAFGVRFNLNNKSTGFTSIDMVKQLIGEAENKDALLQIYKFFIFPLLEKSIKQIKNSIDSDGETLSEIIFKFEYKAKKGINTYCTIQDETFKEFVNKLSGFSSEELKFDLKEKVSEQLYTINNYITKSNK